MNAEQIERHADFIEKVKGDRFQIFGLWRECPPDVKWAWGARTIFAYNERLGCYMMDIVFDRQTSYGDKEMLKEFAERFNKKELGLKTICDIGICASTYNGIACLTSGTGTSVMQSKTEIEHWMSYQSSHELLHGHKEFFRSVRGDGFVSGEDSDYDILCKVEDDPGIDAAYSHHVSYPNKTQPETMRPDKNKTFTLWHNGSEDSPPDTFIKANTNASHGYLYLIAYQMESNA